MSSSSVDRRLGLTGGTAFKAPCACASATNITLSGEQTIDGVTTSASRVLVTGQTTQTANGIYVSDTGSWTRDLDFDGNLDVKQGTLVFVVGGTSNTGYWYCTSANPITIGTSNLTFSKSLVGTNASISFLQAGTGAVTRNAQTKERERISVQDFGAAGDGSTDDAAAIQAAITYAATLNGANVYFQPATYKIGSTITVTTGNTFLIGFGSDISHDVGTEGVQSSTKLKWGGIAGGTMVKYSSPSGGSAQKQQGGGFKGITLDSNYGGTAAAVGLNLSTWNSALVEDVFTLEFSTAGVLLDCLAAGSIGEAQDTQQNILINVRGRNVSAGGSFIRLDGNATAAANSSMNLFIDCDAVFTAAAGTGGFDLKDADNNTFIRCRLYPSSACDAIVCHASALATGYARDNTFLNFSTISTGAIQAKGTGEATFPSLSNNFILLDKGNGSPAPTVGVSATCNWSFTDGTQSPVTVNSNAASSTNLTAAIAGMTLRGVGVDAANNFAELDVYGNVVAPGFLGRHARGTATASTAVQNGDTLVGLYGQGHNSSSYNTGAGIRIDAAQTWTTAANGAVIVLQTCPSSGTIAVDRLRVQSAGDVMLNASNTVLSTAATGGFTHLPNSTGTPQGVPGTLFTGAVPMQFDIGNNFLWAYVGGKWLHTVAFTT